VRGGNVAKDHTDSHDREPLAEVWRSDESQAAPPSPASDDAGEASVAAQPTPTDGSPHISSHARTSSCDRSAPPRSSATVAPSAGERATRATTTDAAQVVSEGMMQPMRVVVGVSLRTGKGRATAAVPTAAAAAGLATRLRTASAGRVGRGGVGEAALPRGTARGSGRHVSGGRTGARSSSVEATAAAAAGVRARGATAALNPMGELRGQAVSRQHAARPKPPPR
jgi:hypothetical protein